MTTTTKISTGSRGRSHASGFTLIEIMVVLAVVGLIMGLGIKGFRSLNRSDLRAASTHLAGSIRFLFDRASTTGKTHRLVLDLEQGRYWAEVSDDKFYVPRDSESPEALARREQIEAQQDSDDEEKRRRQQKEAAAKADTTYGDSSFDLDKLEVGEFKPKRARFAAFKELAFKPETLKKSVVLRSVYTPRVTDPVTAGRAYIYFFPLGQTEPAIVTLSDHGAETIYSLVVHPLTGRVKVYDQDVKPLGAGQRTDDEGNQGPGASRRGARVGGQGPRVEASGFTLLEVMIALAILAITLVVMLSMVTNNLRATRHAKLTTAATFLARAKMSDLEDQILENGFSNSDETSEGNFKDQGYAEFGWDAVIERVELPMDAMQKQKDEAADKARDSTNPMSMLSGFIGGMMGSFIEPIRLGLQESVRRVTVHVIWSESGRPDQVLEVVQYLTDPSKLEAAVAGGIGGAATPAATGAAGAPGGGNPLAPAISPTGAKR